MERKYFLYLYRPKIFPWTKIILCILIIQVSEKGLTLASVEALEGAREAPQHSVHIYRTPLSWTDCDELLWSTLWSARLFLLHLCFLSFHNFPAHFLSYLSP